ncbi:hypothetical protein M2317_003269 [Microbacterium sp. ZKA21]
MSAIRHVAGLLGMSPETLRLWQPSYKVDAGVKPGVITEATARSSACKRRSRICGRRTRLLKAVSVFREGARPPLNEMIINKHRIVSGSSSFARSSDRQLEDSSPPAAMVPPSVGRSPAAAEGRAARSGGDAVARGELWRLRAPEDARAPAPVRVEDRSRSDRTPHAYRRGPRAPEVGAGVSTRFDRATVLPSDLVNRQFTTPVPQSTIGVVSQSNDKTRATHLRGVAFLWLRHSPARSGSMFRQRGRREAPRGSCAPAHSSLDSANWARAGACAVASGPLRSNELSMSD